MTRCLSDSFHSFGLDVCPACEYSLRGLPSRHRCPECGFAYGPETIVWQAKVSRCLAVTILLSCCVLIYVGWIQVTAGFATRSASDARFVIGATAAVGLIAMMGRGLLASRRRPFVAAQPEGLVVAVSPTGPRIIPWERIDDVEVRCVGERWFTWVRLDGAERIDVSGAVQTRRAAVVLRRRVRQSKRAAVSGR